MSKKGRYLAYALPFSALAASSAFVPEEAYSQNPQRDSVNVRCIVCPPRGQRTPARTQPTRPATKPSQPRTQQPAPTRVPGMITSAKADSLMAKMDSLRSSIDSARGKYLPPTEQKPYGQPAPIPGLEPRVIDIDTAGARAGEYYRFVRGPEADTLRLLKPYDKLTPVQKEELEKNIQKAGLKRLKEGVYVAAREEKRYKRLPQFGLELIGREDEEVSAGIFGNVPLPLSSRFELYANAVIPGLENKFSSTSTDSTLRQTQLIQGLHKNRGDYITNSRTDSPLGEAGARLMFGILHDKLKIYAGAGAKMYERADTTSGYSIIWFEENQAVIERDTISGTDPTVKSPTHPLYFAPSVGIIYNVTPNIGIEISGSKVHGQTELAGSVRISTKGIKSRGRK